VTWVRLRHIAQINPPTPAFDRLPADSELTFLPMESVWPDARLDISQRRTKSAVSTGYTRFQDGDVLVPKITPTFEASRSVLIQGLHNGVGAGTTELHVLRAGPKLDPRFLLYLVHTHPFLKLGKAEMYGVAGQQRVPDEFLRNLPVRLPPLDEQRRIADFLDAETARIDQLQVKHREIIRRLHERDRALRDQLVDELFQEVNEVPLRRLFTRIEQGASPQCDAAPSEAGEWGVLKLSAVKRGHFDPTENKRLPDDPKKYLRYTVKQGDLLITRANTPQLVGDVAVVHGPVKNLLLPDLIYRVTCKPGVNAEFVAQVALSSRIRLLIEATSRGSSQSMVKIRGDDISSWPMPMATEDQQRDLVLRIKAKTDQTAQLRSSIQRSLLLLAERRQALITAAVTGQIDVSTASGRGVA
jgi:type I restriction enzyme S subunit